MFLTLYTSLTWAYQLHYYLCFRTHRREQLFSSEDVANAVTRLITEISVDHDYHLLDHQRYPNQLRCLFSLRPSQAVAKTIQILKSNSAREFARLFAVSTPVWAVGYLARSSGHVRTSAVRAYLEKHLHLIVRIVPRMSIEEAALLLLNNGQYFIGERYPELLD